MRGALVTLMLIGACSQEVAPPHSRTFAENTGTILSADSPPDRMLVCQADTRNEGRWTPTQAEVDTLNPVLLEMLEYKLMEHRLTYDDLSAPDSTRYHRHYFGLLRGDRRFILVCGQYDSEPYVHHDGGEHRFATLYDAQHRTFTWFELGYRA